MDFAFSLKALSLSSSRISVSFLTYLNLSFVNSFRVWSINKRAFKGSWGYEHSGVRTSPRSDGTGEYDYRAAFLPNVALEAVLINKPFSRLYFFILLRVFDPKPLVFGSSKPGSIKCLEASSALIWIYFELYPPSLDSIETLATECDLPREDSASEFWLLDLGFSALCPYSLNLLEL